MINARAETVAERPSFRTSLRRRRCPVLADGLYEWQRIGASRRPMRIKMDFSRPGKPTDNAMIEAFNARLREECLNESWFLSVEDAREKIQGWRRHYNGERPHGALGNLAPQVFALGVPAGVQ